MENEKWIYLLDHNALYDKQHNICNLLYTSVHICNVKIFIYFLLQIHERKCMISTSLYG